MTTEIQENYSLKDLNTFGVNVHARYFFSLHKFSDLSEIENHDAYDIENKLVLGGGSNILFTKDYDGLVIKNELKGIELIDEDDEEVLIRVQAGENWHKLVLYCIERGWGGIENLSLIPGCVGAAPIQNIGAYGVELKDVFESVEFYLFKEKAKLTLSKEECNFGYRDSIFKNELKGKILILSVVLRLSKNPQVNISYGAISKTLKSMGIDNPGIEDVSDAVIKIRSSKLPDPQEIGNAGSFFKNPVVQKDHFLKLREKYPEIPSYPLGNDKVKIPAAWLIENSGWKGFREDDYGTHPIQPLVLVNYGSAQGSSINKLADSISQDIQKFFGIELKKEVNIL